MNLIPRLRRLWPDTLFARMALLIAVLFLLGQLAIYAFLRIYEFQPHTQRLAHQWSQLLTLAAAQPTADNPALRRNLARLGLQLSTDAGAPLAGPAPHSGPLPHVLRAMRTLLGPSVQMTVDPAHHLLWLRWTGAHTVTLALPAKQGTPIPVPYVQLIALIAVALLGGLLVVRQVNRPLKSLVDAVSGFGDNHQTRPLRIQGPRDIRELAARFNHLLDDLEELLRERELVLIGVSHDLRTPLTRTRLAVEFLPAAAVDSRAEIIAKIQEMDAIIEQFLNYAREGQEEPTVLTDLTALVHTTVEHFREGPAGLPVTLDVPHTLSAPVQPLALSRALRNLLENAARHGAAPIEVRLHSTNDHIALSVRDHGNGIPPQRLRDLPKPFAQSTSGGAGLGLAIVERIARRLHGRLTLANAADGGLQATLELPIKKDR
ncbi:HAMP domain-containing histidine kinase [Acidihalobacter ferrooxydans]|uniref:histidine kinase n=1 Tax=Acidihalobacter ferrooxydans TaxID=1765967 RepID=A0A1P8UHM4_9GAMM|nr:HAMP domain-containing histidine kinase [Acidihalobacter ferrooxydans]APZ43330.1 hypothetical protein BW247_09670 [Acidihalobacter ferrooxydans]